MDYRWKVTNTGRRSPGTRVPMVAQILRRNVHVVKSMLSSAAAPPSSVMKSRLFIHIAQRVSGDGGDLRFGASGNGEPRDAGCAHGRFRNLAAANTRPIPTFPISRPQNRLLQTR